MGEEVSYLSVMHILDFLNLTSSRIKIHAKKKGWVLSKEGKEEKVSTTF
jgi:hypothetical protein